ncbi:hypothetical protein [Polyangium jinanense]|uniref:Uncharacterized protein n=1 Tax=Polyangium jinanense TaxID=2829994 RepID=A0A9X4AS54_9BACT|nr:hypothetical protein [Polyangium jinanense]MDC3955525.1 hypothetical protein [Polyangium jinanense]MDC3982161.1 hypothetical protein [Polyangium jinanense]
MTAFGPALFVRRTDGKELDEHEQQEELGTKTAREVEAQAPNTYRFDSYTIEV